MFGRSLANILRVDVAVPLDHANRLEIVEYLAGAISDLTLVTLLVVCLLLPLATNTHECTHPKLIHC